jgi:hypothetical protein
LFSQKEAEQKSGTYTYMPLLHSPPGPQHRTHINRGGRQPRSCIDLNHFRILAAIYSMFFGYLLSIFQSPHVDELYHDSPTLMAGHIPLPNLRNPATPTGGGRAADRKRRGANGDKPSLIETAAGKVRIRRT